MKSRHRAQADARRGSALVSALVLGLTCAAVCVGIISTVTARAKLVRMSRDVSTAANLADSALAFARVELLQQKDLDGGGIGTVSGQLNGGSYSAKCTSIDATHFRLVAEGRYDLATQRCESVVEKSSGGGSAFSFTIFGDEWATIAGGAQTDQYDSTVGDYASQATSTDAKGTYAQKGGSVGSNGAITTNGTGVAIRGDATPGVSSSVTINGNGTVAGATTPRSESLVLPPIDTTGILNATTGAPLAAAKNYAAVTKSGNASISAAGVVSVKNGGKLTFPAGSYWVDSISISNGGSIVCNGTVKLYVQSDINATGGSVVNSSASPGNLLIYGLGDSNSCSGASIRVSSKNGLAAVVYAPKADVEITGGGHFYGLAVGRTFKESGGAFMHADSSLTPLITGGGSGAKVMKQISWRRLTSGG